MAGTILRRIRDLIIVLAIVGTAMFVMLRLIPGSAAAGILGQDATQDQIEALERELGYDRPLLEQYFAYLASLLRGDLGHSTSQNMGVTEAIFAYIGPTLVLALAATVLGVVIAVPLSIQTVARPLSWWSRLLMGASSLGLAIPSFWLALILILTFAVQITVFPVSGYVSPFEDLGASIWYLALPVIVILSHQVALLVVTLRESLAGELLNPYIRTARAKGLGERGVYYRHLLPNALLPAVTVIGSNFGALLGGIIIIETVFLIPGMGWALYTGIQTRDYNLVLGITLATALIVVLVNLVVDIVYGILDPRVRVR